MTVWRLKGDGSYSGGMAIVAARTRKRAAKLANENPDKYTGYGIGYSAKDAEPLRGVHVDEPVARVIAHFEFGE